MNDGDGAIVRGALEDSAATLEATARTLGPAVARAAGEIIAALRAGNKVMACGNGGSAADAQHLAAELVGRFEGARDPLPGMALTTDPSVITALSNDFGFEEVFVRQLRAHARSGDVLVALSTSGRSPNVVAAAAWARLHGVLVIALTGEDAAALAREADLLIAVPAKRPARIQEAHGAIIHAICEAVDAAL